MGQLVVNLINRTPDISVWAHIGSKSKPNELIGADVAIDLSVYSASQKVVQSAIEHRVPIVVGTSGWTEQRIAELRKLYAKHVNAVAVLIVPNFSIGSVLSSRIAELVAGYLPAVEIIETHHEGKIDSPSGTAIRTAERLAVARAVATQHEAALAQVKHPSARGQLVSGIPVHSLRLPGVLAEQSVHFGGVGETLTITHRTGNTSSYQYGILLALRGVATLSGVNVGLESLLPPIGGV